ncbi:flagellar hook-basal body complex protein FliE [Treponema sp.]|uniref:flagellar hook-basal body complex protein FliE n=1 Tax=Treponema sp. TaxID=166 RepID=UPI00298E2413|nr:flagellar hook-basal body complex protein FliE [Treponema sp.]MCR5612558.1 flagellar hook-basal body complex protein FliE [Treponema sp.]
MTMNNFDVLNMSKTFSSTGYQTVSSNLVSNAEVSTEKYRKSFDSYILDAVSKMNEQQLDVNRLEEQALVDPDSVDIHDITTAIAKSQMSLSLAKTVVDRVVTGWNEITTTR